MLPTKRKKLKEIFGQIVSVSGIVDNIDDLNNRVCINNVVIFNDEDILEIDHIWFNKDRDYEKGEEVYINGEISSYQRKDGSWDYNLVIYNYK